MASCKTDFLCTLNKNIISYLALALLGRGIRPFMLIFGTQKAVKKFTSTKCWSRKDSLTKLTTPWAIPGISRHPLKSTHTRQSDFRGEITAGLFLRPWNHPWGNFPFPRDMPAVFATIPVALPVLDIFSRQWYWGILFWNTNSTYCVTWCYTHARWLNCVTHVAGRY